MEYFTIADKYFLAVSNFQSHLCGDWSQLFISGTDKSLLFFKTLQRDRGASKLKFFKIGNESFLAIVNLDNVGQETVDLVIYKWRNNSFDKFSEIPPTLRKFGGAASFAIKNKTFISFRGYSAGGEEVSGTGFSRLQTMQKYEARDVKTFQMNGQIFLQTKLVMEGNPTFLRGMEMNLFQSSHFLLLEPLPGIHLWRTVKPSWV